MAQISILNFPSWSFECIFFANFLSTCNKKKKKKKSFTKSVNEGFVIFDFALKFTTRLTAMLGPP